MWKTRLSADLFSFIEYIYCEYILDSVLQIRNKSPLVKGLSQGPRLVKTQPIACAGLQPRRMQSHDFPSLLALVLGPKSLSPVFRTTTVLAQVVLTAYFLATVVA